jgi:hypothetical protein
MQLWFDIALAPVEPPLPWEWEQRRLSLDDVVRCVECCAPVATALSVPAEPTRAEAQELMPGASS